MVRFSWRYLLIELTLVFLTCIKFGLSYQLQFGLSYQLEQINCASSNQNKKKLNYICIFQVWYCASLLGDCFDHGLCLDIIV